MAEHVRLVVSHHPHSTRGQYLPLWPGMNGHGCRSLV